MRPVKPAQRQHQPCKAGGHQKLYYTSTPPSSRAADAAGARSAAWSRQNAMNRNNRVDIMSRSSHSPDENRRPLACHACNNRQRGAEIACIHIAWPPKMHACAEPFSSGSHVLVGMQASTVAGPRAVFKGTTGSVEFWAPRGWIPPPPPCCWRTTPPARPPPPRPPASSRQRKLRKRCSSGHRTAPPRRRKRGMSDMQLIK